MEKIDDLLKAALSALPSKPEDSEKDSTLKKRYSERMSEKLALAFAQELRNRGLSGARPAPGGIRSGSGAERRMSGGIGAKKVDVTWATEESGLIFAISIKTINFRDSKTKNYQKNLVNRRGDILMEAVTLHRRFPYAVLIGFMFLDAGAENDGTERRESTFTNAHIRLQMFTGRDDPAGRDEQFERLFLFLVDASNESKPYRAYEVGEPSKELDLDEVFDQLMLLIVQRNPDLYSYKDGKVTTGRQ